MPERARTSERNRGGRSRSKSRSARGRSKSRPRKEEAADRGSKKGAAQKRNKAKNNNRRRKASGPSLQSYLDEAVKSATTAAMSMFDDDNDYDDDSQLSPDEISFATESSHTNSGGKNSAADDSVDVAAVTSEGERRKLQHQHPDIATFRLKKTGRPRSVRKLVKKLAKDEQKYQNAARALNEAEENMWKTKWKLYNLADEFGLLCGNNNGYEDLHHTNEMLAHDAGNDDDSYAYSRAYSDYSDDG